MIAGIRYHSSGVSILRESIIIRAMRAPDPTECNEIFHRKFIIVTNNDNNAVAKIYDLKNTGIGNLKMIYDVDPYNIVVIINGMVLSFLSEIAHDEITCRRCNRGNNETGINTLFTTITRNNIFFTLNGR